MEPWSCWRRCFRHVRCPESGAGGPARWWCSSVYFFMSSYLPLLWGDSLARFQVFNLQVANPFVGAAIAVLIYELLVYVWHRAMHKNHWLWRGFHQMHHSAERVDSFGAFYFSPLDIVGFTLLSSIALSVVGLPAQAITYYLYATMFLAVIQHANIRTPQWLGYIVQRPESHSVHHGRGIHHFNYSDLPLFDILFGTFRNPQDFIAESGFEGASSAQIVQMLMFKDIAANDFAQSMQTQRGRCASPPALTESAPRRGGSFRRPGRGASVAANMLAPRVRTRQNRRPQEDFREHGHRHTRLQRAVRHLGSACTASATCSPSPAGTRPPTCRPRATRRAPRRWPKWPRCCTACAPTRAARAARARRAGAARRPAARQPARDAARVAAGQRAARSAGAAPAAGQRRAASTPGARSARPTTGPASCANFREVLAVAREEAALLSRRRAACRSYDALMDRFEPGMTSAPARPRVRRGAAWLPGLIQQVHGQRQARETVVEPVGPFADRRAARAVRARHAPAGLRLRRRPARRQHAPVLRRRARGRAHDHALPRRRLPAAA